MSKNPKVVSFDRSAAYLHHRAMMNRRDNHHVDALELMRRAVEAQPENSEYRLDLAELYCEMGCHQQSSRLLLDMLSEKDAPSECFYGLALNQLGMNDLTGAKQSLSIYRKRDPQGVHFEDVRMLAAELDYYTQMSRPANRRLNRAMRVANRACDALLSALQQAYGQMRAGRLSFGTLDNYLGDADQASRPLEGAAGSIEYPTLIYDGPFSDVVSEDAPQGLGEKTVTREEAVALAAAFVGAAPENAAFTQESGGSIPAYGVQVTLPDATLHLAITRQGGQVLWMFPERAGYQTVYGLPECRQAAERFFREHGYGEMELTFWQMYGGMATLSYAAVEEGVLLYPDLVKLQLRLDTLAPVGLEARHYLSSHRPRNDLSPALSRAEAQARVSPRLEIVGARLCVIPLNRREYLCWEFTGVCDGKTYYVYIDAATGEQRDIQRLVENEYGPRAE